jgi:uncharacterized protein (TIGR03067 family)
MRWTALLMVCVAVGTTLAGGAGDANKKFLDAMQGEWKMQKAIKGGKAGPEEKIASTVLIVTGEEISVREGDNKPREHAKVVIDASKKPISLDIIPAGKVDGKILGIVVLEGDVLRICFSKPGTERPKEFASADGSDFALMELKRIAKK